MSHRELNDPGLTALLDLDGEIFPMVNGFWTIIDAKIVMQSDGISHGVRYSLTLHNSSNLRVLGYDNAHQFKSGRKGMAVGWSTIYIGGENCKWYNHNGGMKGYSSTCFFDVPTKTSVIILSNLSAYHSKKNNIARQNRTFHWHGTPYEDKN